MINNTEHENQSHDFNNKSQNKHAHTHTHKYSKELCSRIAQGLDDLKADNF